MQETTRLIDGRRPRRREPLPPCHPGGILYGPEEEAAVLEVIRGASKGVTLARYGAAPLGYVRRFEEGLARAMGTRHAIALTSGTAGLICALAGLGLGEPGDEVIVPAYTWIATANAVIARNLVPVVAEVDDTLNLDPADFEAKITPRTRAVIVVHMRGVATDMDPILAIARKHHLAVIEDCCQAMGAKYRGRRLGSIGDAGAYSLQHNKVITCGEGGALVTSDERLYLRAYAFADHGYNARVGSHVDDPETGIPGMKFGMSEIHGALAAVQLTRLDSIISTMRRNQATLLGYLRQIPGLAFRRVPDPEGDTGQHLIMLLPSEQIAERFAAMMMEEKLYVESPRCGVRLIESGWHWVPNIAPIMERRQVAPRGGPWVWPHFESPVQYLPDPTPRSTELAKRAVRLDLGVQLTEDDLADIASGIYRIAHELL